MVDENASDLKAFGLASPRVDVTFQGASFDAIVAWLLVLHGTYGIDVETASFSSGREQGLVNGQISLNRL